jgi:hypothetical protein
MTQERFMISEMHKRARRFRFERAGFSICSALDETVRNRYRVAEQVRNVPLCRNFLLQAPSPSGLPLIAWSVSASLFKKTIDDKTIAGALTLLLRHGPVAWFEAPGMQGSETGKPMRSDTIFRI